MSQFAVSLAGAVRSALGMSALILCAGALNSPLLAQLTVTGYNAASITMSPNGSWSLTVPGPQWTFSGSLGTTAVASRVVKGKDALGSFEEIDFNFNVSVSSRTGSIRLYESRPAVLFSVTWNNASSNVSPFPVISKYPASVSHLTYNGLFSPADFIDLLPDSPWTFFDPAGNTFILSPAQNFMTATTVRNNDLSISTGISTQIATLPAGFSHSTMLVFGKGIDTTVENWGSALTLLKGKKRVASDSEALLKSVSYWTDNGATYYYEPGGPSYTDTLASIKKEFDAKGIRLGSLQLDSWWYPKGPDNSWSSHSGIWTYTASPALFAPDLATFQSGLKIPLVTHARWIDINSPYRTQYTMSGGVITDPAYWESIGSYLKSSGVTTYEQDWLGQGAATNFNLTDPDAFLGNMAASMSKHGLTIQYCMANPNHFMQSTNYGNVTTIRTSQDRLRRENWSDFFYSSRFASALNLWPFSDVFMSTETSNLILATLSAGPVGVGDAMGNISKTNLLRSVRADGVIVKPDLPATPIDSVYQNDARGVDVPMVASAHTDFGRGLRTHYIFTFVRGVNRTVTIDPADYGMSGAAYLYDSLQDSGRLIDPHGKVTFDLTGDYGYYVLAPVGDGGIAVLGDKDQFVTTGKKRIPWLVNDSQADLKVTFAAGEKSRTIFGYSAYPLTVSSIAGTFGGMVWDPSTQIFTVNVHPVAGTAHLRFRPQGAPGGTSGCPLGCSGGTPLPGPVQGQ